MSGVEQVSQYERDGYEAGVGSAGWAMQGLSVENMRAVLQGYEDGDPVTMDMEPSPLSGAWADEPTPLSLAREYGIDAEDDSAVDAMRDEYEAGFSEGFWNEVQRICAYHLAP